MNMAMCERMTEERLIGALRAVEQRFECKLYISAHQVKLSGNRLSLIWDKSFLLGKSRGEVKDIVMDAVKSKFMLRADKEIGTAHLQHLTLVINNAPAEEVAVAEKAIKEAKAKRSGPRQKAFRFTY